MDSLGFKHWFENNKYVLVTDNPLFWAWFKNSKIVDSQGNPLVVYHQTSAEAMKKIRRYGFSPDKATTSGIIWVTSDKSKAERRETGADASGAIIPLYASIQKPAGWDEYDNLFIGQIRKDFDGIVLPSGDGHFSAIVFDPKQLKSVDNKGTFSLNKRSILR